MVVQLYPIVKQDEECGDEDTQTNNEFGWLNDTIRNKFGLKSFNTTSLGVQEKTYLHR